MEQTKVFNFIKEVLKNMPLDWLNRTTHRLDIYDESLAKTQFLEYFGDKRRVSISREISKFYEETQRGTISDLISQFKLKKPKGEFVIVVEGKK